jgi:cytochrome b involved in lipid metabolism
MKTKTLVLISLLIFWIGFSGIVAAGLILYQNNKGQVPLNPVNSNSSGQTLLSTQEVEKHNTSHDCWVIVNNKVYDLTTLINSHSGGAGGILASCGKDGTSVFLNQGHSASAKSILNTYSIGNLGSNIK